MSLSGIGGSATALRSFQPPSFTTLDSDSSGGITLDELKSGAPKGASDSKSAERAEKLFTAMDTDADGSVTSTEKDAFDARMAENFQAMQFAVQLMAGGAPPPPPSNEEVFAATDADGSGAVSLEEFSDSDAVDDLSSDQLEQLFSLIDSDGSGEISETESSTFLDALRSAAGGPSGPSGPGGPPPGPPPSGGEVATSNEEDEDDTALDLLKLASNAYTTTETSSDLLSTLTSIFDKAA
jgi:Ca2+-binding EF-hand superfamily protein